MEKGGAALEKVVIVVDVIHEGQVAHQVLTIRLLAGIFGIFEKRGLELVKVFVVSVEVVAVVLVKVLGVSRESFVVGGVDTGLVDLEKVVGVSRIGKSHGLEDDVVVDVLAGVLGREGLVVGLLDCLGRLVLVVRQNVFDLLMNVLFLLFLLLLGRQRLLVLLPVNGH